MNEAHAAIQVDTGPVLFPTLPQGEGDVEEVLDSFVRTARLAFVGWNTEQAGGGGEGAAEWLLREPEEIAEGVRVQHFGGLRRTVGCRNQLFALGAA